MGISRDAWLDRKSKKFKNKKYRERNNLVRQKIGRIYYKEGYFNSVKEYSNQAPSKFSFLYNTEETINFFLGYIEEMKRGSHGEHFYFDSINVEKVTLDVLTYIIALSKNLRKRKINNFIISGNIPKEGEARKIYEESGFLNFFKSKTNQLPPNTKRFKLISGNRSRGEYAKEICDFVIISLNKDRIFTQKLQNNLIEMMLNASSHAYANDNLMEPVWYCCAEYSNNRVRIAFLDTGIGIAKTVKKNYLEKIGIATSDAGLIYSALMGEFRTSTKEENRGNGLPSICETAMNGYYDKFMVLSGGGSCAIVNNGGGLELTKLNYKHKIYGTIYIFDIVL